MKGLRLRPERLSRTHLLCQRGYDSSEFQCADLATMQTKLHRPGYLYVYVCVQRSLSPIGERVRVRGQPCAYRAVGAETIFPCSGAATTISFRAHARPLTPTLSPAGGEGGKHRATQIRTARPTSLGLPEQRVAGMPASGHTHGA